ncbi:MAG: phenylalanine--tRNA ligase subunit alpha [Patescibacteria group bacterium]|jgi:phenylalanyl-tRNA synthetase alpha chain
MMLTDLKKQVEADLHKIKQQPSTIAIVACEQKYFSRKTGLLTQLLKGVKDLPVAQRKEFGEQANLLRHRLETQLATLKTACASGNITKQADLTLPGILPNIGHLHPLTQVAEELMDIFVAMGFMVYEGPELDNEFYNFEALNIPASHPARDIQDTFFIKTPIIRQQDKMKFAKDSKWVMRTHTSNMQVRMMQKFKPPLRCIIPGRVFRNEATDASHEHTFYQLEGFIVDENVSIGQLIWTLREIFRKFYKQEVKIRLRPGYFPFTEPSYEPDMSCTFCDQKGCKVCKYTGWVEMGGSGMIHPNVLKAAGYPAGKYTGFAFGMGINRLAMLKYDIDDGRRFMENDLRFLKQF